MDADGYLTGEWNHRKTTSWRNHGAHVPLEEVVAVERARVVRDFDVVFSNGMCDERSARVMSHGLLTGYRLYVAGENPDVANAWVEMLNKWIASRKEALGVSCNRSRCDVVLTGACAAERDTSLDNTP